MKCNLALAATAVLVLASCNTATGPMTSSDFDPLRPPGSSLASTSSGGNTFKAGQFVRASMDSTAFFKVRPEADGDADQLLSRNTTMKVISTSGSYLKVELDSGEIGFVPSIMVEDPNAMPNPTATTNPGEFQVYPPLSNEFDAPLPLIDPAGLPPEGAIPTVIDPDAPPAVVPANPAPATIEDVPLPPNGEELEALKKSNQTAPEVEADSSGGQ